MQPAKLNVDTLFCEAIAIDDATARAAFIEQSSRGDSQLRQHLEKLVAAHFRAGDFLQRPVAGAVDSLAPAPAVAPCATQVIGSTIGPYKIRELLGEGGMGSVYVAEQDRPVRRKVALKVIKPGMDSRDVIARFEAERQALTMMEHPHIARVLDAGTTAPGDGGYPGRPYFVMELVKGLPITEHCDAEQLSIHERLELFLQVCRAVQHAHQKAVIHRDLKPSNILVALHDTTPVVKVIDFGVAKALKSKLTDRTLYTGFNQLLGTPLYMSPEQAEMNYADVDTRSDVYALGVLLYELLTGTTPFAREALSKASLDELRRIIREQEPLRPSTRLTTLDAQVRSTVADRRKIDQRRISDALRGELDWIVMRAMEKDRNRRYPTASALAIDVERYLRNEPIEAGPPSQTYRAWKFACRNRLPLAASACILLAFMSATVVSLREAGKARQAQRLADERFAREQAARLEIQDRESRLQIQLYASDIAVAWDAWIGGNRERALELLERHLPRTEAPHVDLREFAWHYLAMRCRQQPLNFAGHQAPVLTADISPDDRLVASADRAGGIRIWDIHSAAKVAEWNYSNKEVTSVAFSPDGRTLATCGQDATVRLWSVGSWEEVGRLDGHEHTVMCVAWSPDGRRLASSCRGGEVRVWKADSREQEICLNDHDDAVRCAAWSPDGTLLAVADGPAIKVFSTQDWSLITENHSLSGGILCLAFSPNGRWLAFGGYPGSVVICDSRTGREQMRLGGIAGIWSMTFTPDASHLLVGSGEGGPQIFRFESVEGRVEMVRTAFERGGTQRAVRMMNSGQHLLTATEETSQLRLWDFRAQLGFRQSRYRGNCLGVLPRRGLVITAAADGAIELCSDSGNTAGQRLIGHARPVEAAAADTAEQILATCTPDGDLRVWDLVLGTERLRFDVPKDSYELHFAPAGATLAVVSSSAGVQLWDAASGKLVSRCKLPTATRTCAFTPDGRILALAARDKEGIYLWDLSRDQISKTLESDQSYFRLCFSADGTQLLAGGRTSDVVIWNVRSGREQARLLGHRGPVRDLATSCDGQTLATVGADRTVRLWHVPSGQQLSVLSQVHVPHWLTFVTPNSLVVCVEDDSPYHRGLITFDTDMASR